MKPISEKIYLTLTPPTEGESIGIQQKLYSSLSALGYTNIHLSLPALRHLYPACLEGSWHITVCGVWQEDQFNILSIESATRETLIMDSLSIMALLPSSCSLLI